MENKEDKNLYRNLSKKELQDLCKRYGLSPYMTKSNLVNSLYSYCKKKNLSSISQVESASVRSSSLIPPLDCGPQSDYYVNVNCPGEKDNRENHFETVKCNVQGSFMEAESISKASGCKIVLDLECPSYNVQENSHLTGNKREASCSQIDRGCSENVLGYRVESPKISSDKNNLPIAREVVVSDAPQIRSTNLKVCLAENTSNSTIKSSKAIRSFKFYVSSEEGINLFVDLNSSPSDRCKRFESEVCGFHVHDNKLGSLREEIELLGNSNKQMKNSILCNTDSEHEMKNDDVQAVSSYSIERKCDPDVVPCLGDETLRSSPIQPCNVAKEASARLEEYKEPLHFSGPNSDALNHVISGAESYPMDREPIGLESSVINNAQIKSSCNTVTSMPEGQNSLNLLEHQSLVVGDKNCADLTLQNTCTHVSRSVAYPGSPSTSSMKMQSPEVVSQQKDALYSPCRNSDVLDVVEPMANMETRDDELACSSTCQGLVFASAEERERSKLTNEAETLELLQFTKSLEKKSEYSEVDKVLKNKRRHSEVEGLNCCGEHNARILRSRKHLHERVLPRRSMRLVSK